jgi:NACHT domain
MTSRDISTFFHVSVNFESHVLLLQQQRDRKGEEFLEDGKNISKLELLLSEASLERRCKNGLQSNPMSEFDIRRRLQSCRAKGSGTLFFQGAESPFVSWRDGPQPNILALYGHPGSGKSMAMATIMDLLDEDLVNHAESDPPVFCSFFCRDDGRRSNYTTVLRSLAAQMIDQNRVLLSSLIERVRGSEAAILGSEVGLEELVSSLIRESPCQLFILIDAIDECDQTSQKSLLDFLSGLYLGIPDTSRIKCLLSSRPGTLDQFSARVKPVLLESYQNKDMPLIVRHHVDTFLRAKQYDTQVESFLLEFLFRNAGGCALWVKIILEYLLSTGSESTNITVIRHLLKDMPPGLDGVYTKMISRLKPPNNRYVLKALGILAVAFRPLTLEELSFAVALEPRDPLPSTVHELNSIRDPRRLPNL